MKSETIFPNISNVKLPFLTSSVGLNKEQCPIIRENGYFVPQIILSVEGSGLLETEGKVLPLEEGSAFFLPAGVEHRYRGNGKWVTSWIHLAGENMKETLKSFGLSNAVVLNGMDTSRIDRIMRQILSELKADRINGMERSSVHIYELLMEFYMLQNEQERPQGHGVHRILPLLDYIDEHIADQMTLVELAGVLQVTPQHLCRTFKEALNMRPFEYINRRRIQISKRYLADRTMKIATVGRLVGIRDVSYYCYNFKKLEGITPNEFRVQNF